MQLPVKIAEWLAVVLDLQIPDLLEQPKQNKETELEPQGKIGLFEIAEEKLTSLAPFIQHKTKGLVKA